MGRVVIRLPKEAGGHPALLLRTMYGTRDAAAAWNDCIQEVLVTGLGCVRGLTCPCVFWHQARHLRVLVHGDDFVTLGPEPCVRWFRKTSQTHWLVKERGLLGRECQEITFLNRIL